MWWLWSACTSGGPVDGPADAHCEGVDPVVVDPDACDGPEEPTPPGEPMYGATGADDACKYEVAYQYSRASRHGRTAFDLTLTALADGSEVTDASPELEATLDGTDAVDDGIAHESGFGRYTIDGVRFGAPGRWIVRFHLFEACAEGESSPHGHAAFWFDVP